MITVIREYLAFNLRSLVESRSKGVERFAVNVTSTIGKATDPHLPAQRIARQVRMQQPCFLDHAKLPGFSPLGYRCKLFPLFITCFSDLILLAP